MPKISIPDPYVFDLRMRNLFVRFRLRILPSTSQKIKKNLSTVLWLFYDFLSSKNDGNVPLKRKKHKNLENRKKFCWRLEGHRRKEQDPEPDPVPEIIDTVFAKTSPIRSFSMTEYERFGLVFTKTRVYKFGHGSQRCGSKDPDLDPYEIVTDPEHCLK
jgi:hypothetical protein